MKQSQRITQALVWQRDPKHYPEPHLKQQGFSREMASLLLLSDLFPLALKSPH